MKKHLATMGLMLLFIPPLASSEAADRQTSGQGVSDRLERQDRSRADACDCCQKCKDAKGSITPKAKEGAATSDACRDCCDRCGSAAPPAPQEMPPEIIEKRVKPDAKEKK